MLQMPPSIGGIFYLNKIPWDEMFDIDCFFLSDWLHDIMRWT
jgi:hypothetical protein